MRRITDLDAIMCTVRRREQPHCGGVTLLWLPLFYNIGLVTAGVQALSNHVVPLQNARAYECKMACNKNDGRRSDLPLLCQDFEARLRKSSHTRTEAELGIDVSVVHETCAQLSDRCSPKGCAASLHILYTHLTSLTTHDARECILHQCHTSPQLSAGCSRREKP